MLLNKLHALIVDDSATMRKILRFQLADFGLRFVEEAAHGHKPFKPVDLKEKMISVLAASRREAA